MNSFATFTRSNLPPDPTDVVREHSKKNEWQPTNLLFKHIINNTRVSNKKLDK